LNDLDTLVDWPEKVKKMQKEWIGKTSGGLLSFKIEGTVRYTILIFIHVVLITDAGYIY
jgi:leucyl-tRNA synthetase